MSLVSLTRIRQARVAPRAVKVNFANPYRNKKLLTFAPQVFSNRLSRCRSSTPATTSSMMMTGLHTRPLTALPSLQATGHASSALEDRTEAGQVLRDPYEWKSAVGLASALFVASLALAPAPATDHKKFAAEINTKTLRAAAAVTISPKLRRRRVRH